MGGIVKEMGGLHRKLDGIWDGWLSWGDGGLVREMGGFLGKLDGLSREMGRKVRDMDGIVRWHCSRDGSQS